MEQKKINLRFSVLVLMILLAAFSRIIPHIPNFHRLVQSACLVLPISQKNGKRF